jgi:membrane associated rhomboid family serine protease
VFYDTPYTLYLLLITILVSGYTLYQDQSLLSKLAFKPRDILHGGQWYRMLTGGFVHGSSGHLAFNMITLFFFGPVVEARLGSLAFLLVYFGAEFSAHALTLRLHRDTPGYSAVGASGAIAGLVFSFCLFRPFENIYLFFAIGIPAWLFALGFVAFSTMAMRKRQQGALGGIAHEAHLGGAIGGLLLTILLKPEALRIFMGQIGL